MIVVRVIRDRVRPDISVSLMTLYAPYSFCLSREVRVMATNPKWSLL